MTMKEQLAKRLRIAWFAEPCTTWDICKNSDTWLRVAQAALDFMAEHERFKQLQRRTDQHPERFQVSTERKD